MSIVLWVLQGVLAALFVVAGGTKVFFWDQVSGTVASNAALPVAVWMLLGVLEAVCAVLLVAPLVLKRLAMLVPLAAGALVIESVVFVVLHLAYGESGPAVFSLVLGVMAGVVAYGRYAGRAM